MQSKKIGVLLLILAAIIIFSGFASAADAYWSLSSGGPQTSSATKSVGETLYMIGTGLSTYEGQTVTIILAEDDGAWGDDFVKSVQGQVTGGVVSIAWTITQTDVDAMSLSDTPDEDSPYEPYFNLYSSAGSSIKTSNNLDLTITATTPPATSNACFVETRSACLSSGGKVIIGLSGTTNAHGQTYDQGDYPYVLCCNFGDGIQSNECSGGATLLKLSSQSNAHAQISSQSGYGYNVCYKNPGFSCQSATGSCPSGYNPVLSLSSSTNAHIGAPSAYSQKVCCNVENTKPTVGPAPTPEVHWSLSSGGPQTSSATKQIGESVYMVGTNLSAYEGQTITIILVEDDGAWSDDFVKSAQGQVIGGVVSIAWTITQADVDAMSLNDFPDEDSPYEPYFELHNSAGTYIKTSNTLNLAIETPVVYYPAAYWSLTSGGPQTSSATKQVGESVYMVGTNLSAYEGQTVTITLAEDDGLWGDDFVKSFQGQVAGGVFSIAWTITQTDVNAMSLSDTPDENSPYEPYFTLYNSGGSLIKTSNNLDLTITATTPPVTPDAYWSESSGGAELNNYEVVLGETILYMNIDNSGLADGAATFQVYEDDILFDDNIRTTSLGNAVSGSVSGGTATAIITLHQSDWDIGDDGGSDSDYQNYYFKVGSITSPNINVTISAAYIEECLITSFCSDYTSQSLCDADVCNVGNASVPSAIDCADENVSCGCWWETTSNSCSPKYSIIDAEGLNGTCRVNQDIADDCADGFLSFGWIGTWFGPSLNPAKKTECENGGVDTIVCPAQIQLPFFGVYNIAIIVVLAILFYIIFFRNKPKRKTTAKTKKGRRR